MDTDRTSPQQEQLEEHSLPGTNQAGKAIAPRETDELERNSTERSSADQTHLDEHSLPGTNQAGKPIPGT
jgi:hypothetical protein